MKCKFVGSYIVQKYRYGIVDGYPAIDCIGCAEFTPYILGKMLCELSLAVEDAIFY